MKEHGATLCGRDWLKQFSLNWAEIKYLSEPQCSSLGEMLRKYSEVFNDELGTLKDINASIIVKADVPPKFCRHRPLPFAMKDRVEKEFKLLEEANIISPVNCSN